MQLINIKKASSRMAAGSSKVAAGVVGLGRKGKIGDSRLHSIYFLCKLTA
jgi:hypothetical protein